MFLINKSNVNAEPPIFVASLGFLWEIILSERSVCYWYFTLGTCGVLMYLGVCYCSVYPADCGEQDQGC